MCQKSHICAECSCWSQSTPTLMELFNQHHTALNPLAAVIEARAQLDGTRGSECNTPQAVSQVRGNAPCIAAGSFSPLGGFTRPY